MPVVIEKNDVTLTKYSAAESTSMVNSQPYLKNVFDVEINTLMSIWGMGREEAEKTHKENMEWGKC